MNDLGGSFKGEGNDTKAADVVVDGKDSYKLSFGGPD